jgi:DNA repair protein RecN (Recombination protein N)
LFVTGSILCKVLGAALVEIHGQHDERAFIEAGTHRALLDAFGGLDAMAESARQAADAFRLHDLSRAHSRLADFVTAFRLLTSLTAAVGREHARGNIEGKEQG